MSTPKYTYRTQGGHDRMKRAFIKQGKDQMAGWVKKFREEDKAHSQKEMGEKREVQARKKFPKSADAVYGAKKGETKTIKVSELAKKMGINFHQFN